MSNIRQIKFSENWDKLKPENFRVEKTFTTFRGYSVCKHKYYIASKEKDDCFFDECFNTKEKDDCFFDVVLKDKKIGVAKLLDVQPMIGLISRHYLKNFMVYLVICAVFGLHLK